MKHSELLCDISVFSLVRSRPADPDCDLPPSEHVPLGRPGDDRRDEVQQLPPAGGGEEVPGGQLRGRRVLAARGLVTVSVAAVRGPGQTEAGGDLCGRRGQEDQQEALQERARGQAEAGQEEKVREETVWIQELSGGPAGGESVAL